VGLRGPGETQLEVDRREMGRRIAHLKQEIEEVRAQRAQHRRRRFDEGVPVVALVGYTNAGKSTLLNALSGANVLAADQLFATLDPTTRRVTLPGGREVLITDTVGFIQKLPTTLVTAFRATLEEISEADLLLHVVDITHDNVQEQVATVLQVLDDLGAAERPMITALNKIDGLPHADGLGAYLTGLVDSVAISALTGEGIPELLAGIEDILTEELVQVALLLPYQRGDLLGLFHQRGVIEREDHGPDGTRVWGKLPARLVPRFRGYVWPPTEEELT
jgi:GTP-binding protein HflX